jgi:L-asparaginase
MKNILIIYTGGTIGMIQDPVTSQLLPFDFNRLLVEIPELNKFKCKLDTFSSKNPIDSSNVNPETWINLAEIIENNYNIYDGFVVLHGTDTMAYTASALSFMLQGLSKPVILTGSQLPIGMVRTDGKENLITAIEIAGSYQGITAIVNEVAVYFENELHRGNRTLKINAAHFNAFSSPNYPDLAKSGIYIHYDHNALLPHTKSRLKITKKFDCNVALLKIFPGMKPGFYNAIINIEGLKGLVLETYGSGNAPSDKNFSNAIKKAHDKGILMVNITQCIEGFVEQGRYQTSDIFNTFGVVSGLDMTTEAALVKLMMVLAKGESLDTMKEIFLRDWAGELTLSSPFFKPD